MSSPVEFYQEASRKFADATKQLKSIVATIQNAATKLVNWQTVGVSSPKSSGGTPVAFKENIDIESWPTGDQITQAIAAWHKLKNATDHAYQLIPLREREGIPPPTIPG